MTAKLSKYTDLEIEISCVLQVRNETIPAIIGALGTIKKRLKRTHRQNTRLNKHDWAPEDQSFSKCTSTVEGTLRQLRNSDLGWQLLLLQEPGVKRNNNDNDNNNHDKSNNSNNKNDYNNSNNIIPL